MLFFEYKHSLAMRLEASAQIAALPCPRDMRAEWKRRIAENLKTQRDPTIVANLKEAAKHCRR